MFSPGDKVVSRLHGKGTVLHYSPQPQFPVAVLFPGINGTDERTFCYTADGYYFEEGSSFRSPFPDLWKEEAKEGPF